MNKFNFPPEMTSEPPDHVDFDTMVIGWEFEVGGKRAVRGFIQPNFEGVLPESEVGQQATLVNSPPEGTSLTMTELKDGQETDRIYCLTEDDKQVYIPAGRELSITAGKRIVEYVRVYVGKPKKSNSVKDQTDEPPKPAQPEETIIGADLPTQEISAAEQRKLNQILDEAFEGTRRRPGSKPPKNRTRSRPKGK